MTRAPATPRSAGRPASLALLLGLGIFCCDPGPPTPAPLGPTAAPTPPPAPPMGPRGPGAGARPEAVPPQRATVLALDPEAEGPRTLAAALSADRAAWSGAWPPPRPGQLWILWWAEGDPAALGALVQPGPPRPDGQLVVLPPGAADGQGWRPLAEVRVSVLDPRAALARWGATPAAPGPALLAAGAAEAIGAHFGLPYTAPATLFTAQLLAGLDPGVAGALGAPVPTGPADARQRRGAPAPGDPDVAVRLAAAGTPEAAPALLADAEPLVRARALTKITDTAALSAALGDPSSLVRAAAAQGLIERARAGDHAGARDGLLRAADHPDAYLRWKAAAGLGGDPLGLPALTAMLSDADIDVRREAALSLSRAPAEAAGRAEAAAALQAAVRDPNTFVQRRALEALPAFPGPETVAALEAALSSPTALVAESAAMALQRLGRPSAPPRRYAPPKRPRNEAEAVAALKVPDAVAQKDLCKLVEEEPWAAAVLSPLLDSPDSELRKAAVGALGRSPAAAPALLRALADPDPDTVVTALVSLAALSYPEPAPYLPFLDHPDAELRLRAAEALAAALRAQAAAGTAWPAAAVAAVARLSRDDDERVVAAVVALDPTIDPAAVSSVLGRRALAEAGRVAPGEAQTLVLAAAPGADPQLARWGRSVIEAEDYLLHVIFSWNTPATRPSSHWVMRPLPERTYGQPDRG